MALDEYNEQIGEMQRHVDKLMKLQDKAFDKLTPEQYEKVKVYHAEAHEMVRGMRKGDFNGIQDLLNKYNKAK